MHANILDLEIVILISKTLNGKHDDFIPIFVSFITYKTLQLNLDDKDYQLSQHNCSGLIFWVYTEYTLKIFG